MDYTQVVLAYICQPKNFTLLCFVLATGAFEAVLLFAPDRGMPVINKIEEIVLICAIALMDIIASFSRACKRAKRAFITRRIKPSHCIVFAQTPNGMDYTPIVRNLYTSDNLSCARIGEYVQDREIIIGYRRPVENELLILRVNLRDIHEVYTAHDIDYGDLIGAFESNFGKNIQL